MATRSIPESRVRFSSGHHCTIYDTRPQDPCRAFVCGWPLPDWMRPDRAGVILLAASFAWRGLMVDVAVPVKDGPTPAALEWLTNFATAQGRPLLYRMGRSGTRSARPRFPGRDARAHRSRRAAAGVNHFKKGWTKEHNMNIVEIALQMERSQGSNEKRV
jgi:hypothetical protein